MFTFRLPDVFTTRKSHPAIRFFSIIQWEEEEEEEEKCRARIRLVAAFSSIRGPHNTHAHTTSYIPSLIVTHTHTDTHCYKLYRRADGGTRFIFLFFL